MLHETPSLEDLRTRLLGHIAASERGLLLVVLYHSVDQRNRLLELLRTQKILPCIVHPVTGESFDLYALLLKENYASRQCVVVYNFNLGGEVVYRSLNKARDLLLEMPHVQVWLVGAQELETLKQVAVDLWTVRSALLSMPEVTGENSPSTPNIFPLSIVSGVDSSRPLAEQREELLSYLEDLRSQKTQDRRLEGLTLLRLGEVELESGQMNSALLLFEESLVIFRTLFKNNPSNTGSARDVCMSLRRIGEILLSRNDLTGAEEKYTEALAIAKQLHTAHPDRPHYAEDVSDSLVAVGSILASRSDLTGALRFYEESLAIAKHLRNSYKDNPGYLKDLILRLAIVGDILHSQKDLSGALEHYEESLELAKHFRNTYPGYRDSARVLGLSLARVGQILLARNDLAGALNRFEESLAIAKQLRNTHPDRPEYTRDVWASAARAFHTARAMGDQQLADYWFLESVRALEHYVALRPEVPAADQPIIEKVRQMARDAGLDPLNLPPPGDPPIPKRQP